MKRPVCPALLLNRAEYLLPWLQDREIAGNTRLVGTAFVKKLKYISCHLNNFSQNDKVIDQATKINLLLGNAFRCVWDQSRAGELKGELHILATPSLPASLPHPSSFLDQYW